LLQYYRLAQDFEQHSAQAMENAEKYLSNPVIAFLLVKRFTSDWENIVNTYLDNNRTQSEYHLTVLTLFIDD